MKITIDAICVTSKIIDKLKIDKNSIKEIFETVKSEKSKLKDLTENEKKVALDSLQTEIGIQVVLKLGSKLHEVRDELVKFISIYKDIPKEEAEKIDIIDIVKECMNDEDLKSFLKRQAIPALKK